MAPTPTSAHLHLGVAMSEPVELACESGTAMLFSRPNPQANVENQDALAVLVPEPGQCVLAVADGVGGLPNGRQAASRALEVFAEVVQASAARGGDLREAILDGLESANRAVLEVTGGCTTIAVASIRDGTVRCFHVGDSAVLVVGQRGRQKHLTIAHSPVGYGIEAGLLDASEAMNHLDRNIVSNVLGSTAMKIEIGPPVELARHDTVLVASDGVFDNLSIEEVGDVIRAGSLAVAARRLAVICHERMTQPRESAPSKPDDTTFVLYRPRASRSGGAR